MVFKAALNEDNGYAKWTASVDFKNTFYNASVVPKTFNKYFMTQTETLKIDEGVLQVIFYRYISLTL